MILIPFNRSGLKLKSRAVAVAMKRPFRTKKAGGMVRLVYVEEEQSVFDEAKILVWASALLKLAYAFIAAEVDERAAGGLLPPPFDIPEFTFVAAGIAVAQKPVVASTSSSGTNRAVYLLEERLPGEKTDFVKYLHNASACSDLDANDPDYPRAQFLEFLQHVQYQITHGVAYVSDFQGLYSSILLCRKYILIFLDYCRGWYAPDRSTNHDVSVSYPILLMSKCLIYVTRTLGNNLFGDGNLGDAFEQFPAQHKCNKYCKWFNLKLLKVSDQSTPNKSKGKDKQLVSSHYQSEDRRSTDSAT